MILKVCGLTRSADVGLCLELGFDLLGFIFHPASPRAVSPEQVAGFPRGRSLRVGVFVRQSAAEVSQIMDRAGLDLAQLHGAYTLKDCRELGADRVIKVVWPDRFQDLARLGQALEEFETGCRFFLFDAGQQGGGHGRSIKLTGLGHLKTPRPWILAGGLTPENIPELVAAARPAGLDVNSGVESRPGLKDQTRLRQLSRLLQKSG